MATDNDVPPESRDAWRKYESEAKLRRKRFQNGVMTLTLAGVLITLILGLNGSGLWQPAAAITFITFFVGVMFDNMVLA